VNAPFWVYFGGALLVLGLLIALVLVLKRAAVQLLQLGGVVAILGILGLLAAGQFQQASAQKETAQAVQIAAGGQTLVTVLLVLTLLLLLAFVSALSLYLALRKSRLLRGLSRWVTGAAAAGNGAWTSGPDARWQRQGALPGDEMPHYLAWQQQQAALQQQQQQQMLLLLALGHRPPSGPGTPLALPPWAQPPAANAEQPDASAWLPPSGVWWTGE